MNFQGLAAPLSLSSLNGVVETTGASLAAIWAVLSVETSGCGYLDDHRPKILFERHKFYAITDGRFFDDRPDLCNPDAGGYGAGGANQYLRLQDAMALDEKAALDSTSWGLGQIMGFNAGKVGYADATAMATAFADSEDRQLDAMAAFVTQAGLADALRQCDWARFAAGYNGASFYKKGYDKSLELFHTRYEVGPMPDLLIRMVQIALRFVGIPAVGSVDGLYGGGTQKALLAFQKKNGLPLSGGPDDDTIKALVQQAGWEPGP